MKSGIDQAIVEVYTSFYLPADQIVCQPEASAEFASRVNALLPPDQRVDVPVISKRLLNLRRLGQKKGGLPRKYRDYHGREN